MTITDKTPTGRRYDLRLDCLQIQTWQSLYHLLCLKTSLGGEWFSCQQIVPDWPPVTIRYGINKLRKLGLIETQGETKNGLKIKALPVTQIIKHR